jgi:predicted nucleic acid-binding protein
MPYGGAILLADTSAWATVRKKAAPKAVLETFLEAVVNRQLRSSPVVRLEMTVGARNRQDLEDKQARMGAVAELPLTSAIIDAAISGLSEMIATGSPGFQKAPIADALITATAQANGIGVLYYDRDFDRLAPSFGVPAVWVAPRGSIQ